MRHTILVATDVTVDIANNVTECIQQFNHQYNFNVRVKWHDSSVSLYFF